MRALQIVGAVALAGIAAALLSAYGPKAQFTPDGYDYSIMMLMDRGVPYVQAQHEAAAFYARADAVDERDPLIGHWLRAKPEYWELFSVRQFDPWLASLLYPFRGFSALVDVSRASYVLTAMLVVLLSLRFAPAWCGLLLSITLSLFPQWRELGSAALGDALAVALMTATLMVGAACMTRPAVWKVGIFALLCSIVSFTRPITYIALGAAMIAGIAAPRIGDRRPLMAAAALTGVAALLGVVLEIALTRAHAPSFRWLVADTYRHYVARGFAPAGESLRTFFIQEEFTIAWHALVKGILAVLPLLAVVGMFLRRRDPATPLLAGACLATWFGALVDPDHFDVIRCVVMPIAPVLAAFAAAALGDGFVRIPARMGLPAPTLRAFIPVRALVRKATVKE